MYSLLTAMVASIVMPVTMDARGAQTWDVDISGLAFHQEDLPIQVGDTVVWTNNDGIPHTVTSTDGSGELDSGTIADGGTYTHKFTTVDLFTYRCEIHPSMTGSVIVNAIIPEFSDMPIVLLGLLVLTVGLMVVRRRI